jgi:hypothetical protein
MAVYSFSTRAKFPTEDDIVKEIKAHCDKHKLNFSRILIEALTEWRAKHESRTLPNNRKS